MNDKQTWTTFRNKYLGIVTRKKALSKEEKYWANLAKYRIDTVGTEVKYELPIPGVPVREEPAKTKPSFDKMKSMVASYFAIVPSVDKVMAQRMYELANKLQDYSKGTEIELKHEAFQKKITKDYVDQFIKHLQSINVDYDADQVVSAMMCTDYMRIMGRSYDHGKNDRVFELIYKKYSKDVDN